MCINNVIIMCVMCNIIIMCILVMKIIMKILMCNNNVCIKW